MFELAIPSNTHTRLTLNMADAARLKNIRIRTGVLKRIIKEKDYYIKEAETERKKLKEMKQDSTKDSHDVNKQNEILAESLMMIPDCDLKMKNAFTELLHLSETDSDLSGTEEHTAALAVLDDYKENVESRS